MPDGSANIMVEPTTIDEDMGEAVRAMALLADVTIGTWSGEISDAKLMARLKAEAGAQGNVGRIIINMLTGADEALKATKSAYAAVRTLHYAMTLPWVSDPHAERLRGPRLLPNMLFEKYLGAMSGRRREAVEALDKFIAGYDDNVVTAKANLAGLSAIDYPTKDQVRAAFKVSFDFEPIPAGNAFRGLPPKFGDKLAANLRVKQDTMMAGAQKAAWSDVRERVEHLHGVLDDAEAKFKSTTVEAVRGLLLLLPGWNLTGDARMAEINTDIDRMMFHIADAKDIRKDENLRLSTAGQCREIIDKLDAWGVGR